MVQTNKNGRKIRKNHFENPNNRFESFILLNVLLFEIIQLDAKK
jgi:hypothetical protein